MTRLAPNNSNWDDREAYLDWRGIDRSELSPSQEKTLNLLEKHLTQLTFICTTSNFGKTVIQPISKHHELEWFFGRYLDSLTYGPRNTNVYLSAASAYDGCNEEGGIWVFHFGDDYHYEHMKEDLYKIFTNCTICANTVLKTITVLTNCTTTVEAYDPGAYGFPVEEKPNYFVPIFGDGIEIYKIGKKE